MGFGIWCLVLLKIMSLHRKLLLLTAGCCLLIVGCWFYYTYHEKKFEVVFFDVGQGDAALINLPGDNEILIDGGPDNSVLYKLGQYLPIYNRDIELMILTHPHSDHLNGLLDVLQRYKVEQVLYNNKVEKGDENYEKFLAAINSISFISPISPINLGGGNFLEIIYPWPGAENESSDDLNNTSLVLRLTLADGQKFLFAADASVRVEEEILQKYSAEFLTADVLKIGHHGSEYSSSEKFLEAMKPAWAIISVGENKFGHPSLRTIRRLERVGIQIWRTDELGDKKIGIGNREDKNFKL